MHTKEPLGSCVAERSQNKGVENTLPIYQGNKCSGRCVSSLPHTPWCVYMFVVVASVPYLRIWATKLKVDAFLVSMMICILNPVYFILMQIEVANVLCARVNAWMTSLSWSTQIQTNLLQFVKELVCGARAVAKVEPLCTWVHAWRAWKRVALLGGQSTWNGLFERIAQGWYEPYSHWHPSTMFNSSTFLNIGLCSNNCWNKLCLKGTDYRLITLLVF